MLYEYIQEKGIILFGLTLLYILKKYRYAFYTILED